MESKEYVTLQIERTRGQLRAAAFINLERMHCAYKVKNCQRLFKI